MVAKIRRRLDCRVAACASRRSPSNFGLMNGASKRPAPTLPTNCLRLGMSGRSPYLSCTRVVKVGAWMIAINTLFSEYPLVFDSL